MRAVNFMAILTENPKLDAKVFSAKGFESINRPCRTKPLKGASKTGASRY